MDPESGKVASPVAVQPPTALPPFFLMGLQGEQPVVPWLLKLLTEAGWNLCTL